MNYYFAPMEGVTSYIYRNAHHRHFGGVDQYYCPFLSPGKDEKFSKKEMRDILRENNGDTPVVPQLLTRNPEHFIWAARLLADLGYGEVNLNLGCPSGTVVAKGKGAGFLAFPLELEKFLDEIFAHSPLPISIKTRLGRYEEEDFPQLLELFSHYPMTQFIVHPRVQQDFYRSPVRLDAFQLAAEGKFTDLCYNGDIYTTAQCQNIVQRFLQIDSIMLGRGLIANPALARQCQGGAPADVAVLEQFLAEVFEGYAIAFDSRRNAMLRMKELWSYLGDLFEDSDKLIKKLRKTNSADEYQQIEMEILHHRPLHNELDGLQSSIF